MSFIFVSKWFSFVGLHGLRPELFDIQDVKLCMSFCRAGNERHRFDVGTPEAKSQGGGLSGDVAGARVYTKVISFFALAGNGRGSALAGNGRCSFFGEEGAYVDIRYNDGSLGAVAHVKEFLVAADVRWFALGLFPFYFGFFF